MISAVILLLCVDALIFFVAVEAARKRIEKCGFISVSSSVALAAAAFAGHVLGAYPLSHRVDLATLSGRLQLLAPFILGGLAPAFLCGRIVVDALAHSATNWLYGMGTARPVASDFSRAKTRADRNDIDGAVQEYRSYFSQDQATPRALFHAAELLASIGRYAEAADIFREIMQKFKQYNQVWVQAAMRLADLNENYLNEPDVAVYLLKEIAKRLPESEQGLLAHERILRMWRKTTPER